MAKINQNYQNFFRNAAAAGYGANQIVSFMENLFQNPAGEAEQARLHEGQAKGTLRPDEQAAAQAIHSSQHPGRLLKGAAKLATTLGGAGYAATQLPGLIQKGLGALGALGGNKSEEGGEETAQAQPEQPKGPQRPGGFESFLAQHPDLGAFLDDLILNKKLSPLQAATEAKKKKKFSQSINDIEENVGQSLEDLLSQFFQGSGTEQEQQQPQGQNQSNTQGKSEFLQGLSQLAGLIAGLKGK